MDTEFAKGVRAAEMGQIESKLAVKSRCFGLWELLVFALSLLAAEAMGSTAWVVGRSVLKAKVSAA